MPHRFFFLWLLLSLALSVACGKPVAFDPLLGPRLSADSEAPLGGAALAQRQLELESASRDLAQFQATLSTLRQRSDAEGHILFVEFVDAYIEDRLVPILARPTQSEHPELSGADLHLRVMTAETLVQLGAPIRAQRVMNEITRRYDGRMALLVEYPPGEAHSLEEALEILQDRRWIFPRMAARSVLPPRAR